MHQRELHFLSNHIYYYLLLLLFTAIGFSPGGSGPYTSTHNTNGHIICIKITIQNKLYTITTNYTQLQLSCFKLT
jgi:hypothetical protein